MPLPSKLLAHFARPGSRRHAHLLLSLPLALLGAQSLAAQTTLNVTNIGELRTAINQANAGSGDFQINLAAGSYLLSGAALDNANVSGDLDITKAGGNLTVAGPSGAVVDGNGVDRVFHINAGAGVNVTFQGITVRNGLAVDDGTALGEARGGGIYNQSGNSLTLTGVHLLSNQASGAAGAVGADGVALGEDGSPGAAGAAARGGGIYSAGGALTLTDCNIAGNVAQGGAGGKGGNGKANHVVPTPPGTYTGGDGGAGGSGGGGEGGGVFLAAGSAAIDRTRLASNVVFGGLGGSGGNGAGAWSFGGVGGSAGQGGPVRGGAIHVGAASAQVAASTLSSNLAVAGHGGVGGIGGSTNSIGANVSYGGPGGAGGNGGTGKGGGCYVQGGSLTLVNSTLSGGQASAGNGGAGGRGGNGIFRDDNGGAGGDALLAQGGGIAVEGGTLSASNSTVAFCQALQGNAGAGGGVPPYGGSTTPAQTGPSGGAALSQGGGLFIGSGSVSVTSCIFSDSTAGQGLDVHGSLTAGASLFEAAPAGTVSPGTGANVIGVDPMLQALAFNGGPTQTHALPAASPAVGAGTNPLSLATDQRGTGFARVVGSQADIGAFEYSAPVTPPATPVVSTPSATLTLNASDFLVQGTADAGTLVRIYTDLNNNGIVDGGDGLEASQQLAAGVTNFSMLVALTQDAANNFLATAANSGGESGFADVPTIIEDSTPPAAPVITNPAAAVSVTGANFTITGSAEAGTLLKVYTDLNNDGMVNGGDSVVAQFQLASASTNFSVPTPIAAAQANDFVATATDSAGNESAPADVPTITETSTPVTAAPTVTSPSAPMTLNAPDFAIAGLAPADSLVRVYTDLNNDGIINGGDAPAGQQQLTGGGTSYSVTVALVQNAANSFLVTAEQAGKLESAPVDVPTLTDDSGVSGGSGSGGGGGGGCSTEPRRGLAALAALLVSLLLLLARRGRRSTCGTSTGSAPGGLGNMPALLLLGLLALVGPELSAQTPSYTVSSGAASYSDLSTYTALSLSDDDLSSVIAPSGFAFTFFGTSYTQFIVASNGYIMMGPAGTVNDPMPHHTSEGLAISPFWTDLIATKTTVPPEVAYEFAGGVLTVEWRNLEANTGSGPGPTVQKAVRMQALLNCATGDIEFRYGTPGLVQGWTSNTTNSVAISAPGPAAHETINGFDAGFVDTTGAVSAYPADRYIRFTPAPQAPVIVTTSPLPSGTDGQTYSVQFAAQSGTTPYTWSASALPSGWTMSNSGLLSAPGASVSTGSYNFSVTVTDSAAKFDTQPFTVTIDPPPLQITSPATLPAGTAGQAYSYQFQASGGVPPLDWSAATTLPTGWSISATGWLSAPGTSVTTGSYGFTIGVSDAAFNPSYDSKAFTVDIVPATAPLAFATPSTLPQGTEAQAYSHQFNATGGVPPYTFAATGLPSGWSMSATGLLDAAAAAVAPGSFSFNALLSDQAGSTSASFSVTIVPLPALAITTTGLPGATLGTAYAASLAATGGSGSGYTWTLTSGTLPPGITGLPGNGTPAIGINGTPTVAGDYIFIVRVTDDLGKTASRQFTLAVSAPTFGGENESGGCSTHDGATATWLALLAAIGAAACTGLRHTRRA